MKKPHNPEVDFHAWVKKAEDDLKTAEHILTLKKNCPFDAVCFHAQQCAEKYLKALLVHKKIDFPKTHDLRLLMQKVPSDIKLDLLIDEVIPLNRYTIEARYPGDWEPFDREEAGTAVSIARKVRKAVRASLPTARRK